jgi:DNA-binding CsgD family transcriptional regulator
MMGEHVPFSDLGRFPSMITRDVDVARTSIARAFGDVTGDVLGDPRGFEWRVSVIRLGPLVVIPNATTTGGYIAGSIPGHYLALSTGGWGGTGAARGQVTEVVEGRGGTLFSPGAPMDRRSPSAFSALGLRLEQRFLEAQLEALTGAPVPGSIVFALAMRLDVGLGADVDRLLHFLIGELSREHGLLDQPVLAQGLCETLARALLVGQPHDHTHLLERPAPPSGRGTVRLVEEYLEAHAAEPVHLADLTALTGASVRSIEAAFRVQRGTTPASFLRRKRLELARRILLSDAHADPVRVVRASGFLRCERFEAAYARAFGESVAETRRLGHLTAAPSSGEQLLAVRIAALSAREREVCERVARGRLNKQIAAELGISESMVKKHRARGMARLGVTSAAEMAALLTPGRGAGEAGSPGLRPGPLSAAAGGG